MKFYADESARRSRQIFVDALLVLWMLLAVYVGVAVSAQFGDLADQVRKSETAGSSLAGNLEKAGDLLGGTPLVGDDIRRPFDSAGDASQGLAKAGADSADSVDSTGRWIGFVVALVLILIVLPYYLPPRLRFVAQATIAARLFRDSPDPDLWALRALTGRPVQELQRAVPGAAQGWRDGDRATIDALAALELRACGVGR